MAPPLKSCFVIACTQMSTKSTSATKAQVAQRSTKTECVSELSGEKLAAFESYRAYDAFHPPTVRVLAFWALMTFLAFLIIVLLNFLDQYINGLWFLPPLCFLYILLCIARLWIQCEWSLWTAWRRGLKFEERLASRIPCLLHHLKMICLGICSRPR